MSSYTAGQIIQGAREAHPAFNRDRVTDRLCLDEVDRLQQDYFADLKDLLKDRVSQARTLAKVVSGTLTGVDAAGNPYTVTSSADGYAVDLGADGVPYVDTTIMGQDPFSSGFPLPDTSIQLLHVYATLNSGQAVPIHYLEEEVSAKIGGGTGLIAQISGWRMIPIKNPSTAATAWDQVTTVTVVWIDQPAPLAALTDSVSLPAVYGLALKYGLMAYLAAYSAAQDQTFPANLLAFFQGQKAEEFARARNQAKFDHRIIKERRMMRNR